MRPVAVPLADVIAEHVPGGELTANGLDLAQRLYAAERAAWALSDAIANLGVDTAPDQDLQRIQCLSLAMDYGNQWRAILAAAGLTGVAAFDRLTAVPE